MLLVHRNYLLPLLLVVQKNAFFLFLFSIYKDLVLPFLMEGYLMLLLLCFVEKDLLLLLVRTVHKSFLMNWVMNMVLMIFGICTLMMKFLGWKQFMIDKKSLFNNQSLVSNHLMFSTLILHLATFLAICRIAHGESIVKCTTKNTCQSTCRMNKK